MQKPSSIFRGIVGVAGIAALIHAAAAMAEPISDAYDGTYAGSGRLIAPLSTGTCEDGIDYSVTIRNGGINGRSAATGDRIKGFVTSDGFFTGKYLFRNGPETTFEGLIDDDTFIGGLVTADDRCAWVVKLVKH